MIFKKIQMEHAQCKYKRLQGKKTIYTQNWSNQVKEKRKQVNMSYAPT